LGATADADADAIAETCSRNHAAGAPLEHERAHAAAAGGHEGAATRVAHDPGGTISAPRVAPHR